MRVRRKRTSGRRSEVSNDNNWGRDIEVGSFGVG